MNLANKYRPSNLSEIVGQEVAVRIIQNMIAAKKVPSALILHGTHGTGKTTIARIIAKSLNCLQSPGYCCNKCANCIAINEGSSFNVLELDAASHSGVDDIRSVIESANYRPKEQEFKVYILDEVHMLSNSAFNALLKVLEEPPEYGKFILATTEIKKIPETVRSRCHLLNLGRINESNIIKNLQNICEQESFGYQTEALSIIAQNAEGSMRDAIFLLERAAIYNLPANIDLETVYILLDIINPSIIHPLLDKILNADVEQALKEWEGLWRSGLDPLAILQTLLEELHQLALCKVTEDYSNIWAEKVSHLEISTIIYLWQVLFKSLQEVQIAPSAYSAGEIALIKLMYIKSNQDKERPKIHTESNQSPPPPLITKQKITTTEPVVEKAESPKDISEEPTKERQISSHHQLLKSIKEYDQALYKQLVNSLQFKRESNEGLEFEACENVPEEVVEILDKLTNFLRKNSKRPWNLVVNFSEGFNLSHSIFQDIKANFTGAKVLRLSTGAQDNREEL